MAWWGKKSNDNDDDEDDDDDDGVFERDSDFNSTNDRIIFLIDGRLPMLTHSVSNSNSNNNNNSSSSSSNNINNNNNNNNNNGGGGEGESHLRHCLRFALSVMKLCVVKDSTSVGIMLLGMVSRKKAGKGYDRIG